MGGLREKYEYGTSQWMIAKSFWQVSKCQYTQIYVSNLTMYKYMSVKLWAIAT